MLDNDPTLTPSMAYSRPAYPLTPEAKEAARHIVANWENDERVEQYMEIRVRSNTDDFPKDNDVIELSRSGLLTEWGYARIGILFELAKYNLIGVTPHYAPNGRMYQ